MLLKINSSVFIIVIILSVVACTTKDGSANEGIVSNADSTLLDYSGLEIDKLKLPPGFEIELYARVKSARSMAIAEDGTIFIGSRHNKEVFAIRDTDGDQTADQIFTLATGMRMPNGVAYKNGDLYVAEISKLWKFPNILANLDAPKKELIYDDYPEDGHHGWKYIAFGPDGKLYIPVGAPCNICESKNEMYASITRMNADGSEREIFAEGVRNTVGFTWHPETGNMYFTDNGRDMMGDELPPCELNIASASGQHFGYPYCHAGDIADPEFGDKRNCAEFVAPIQKLGAHVAPLGLKFKSGNMFPSDYNETLFIAEHGSWNRSDEAGHTGHKVSRVKIENERGVAYTDFITGFLNKDTNEAWGRPVDVLFLEDGSMLISDDKAGAIYRVTYQG